VQSHDIIMYTTFINKKANNNLELVSAILAFSVLWVLFGWNYWNGDREAYELFYSIPNVAFSNIEIGWISLNIISKKLNLTFQEFQIIVSFFTLLLYFRFFYVLPRGAGLVALIYIFTFFPLDYVLIRNTLAFGIVLQAFVIILKKKNNGFLKSILCIVLATSIHQSSIFFIFLPFLSTVKKNYFLAIASVLVISIFIASKNLILSQLSALTIHIELYDSTLRSSFLFSIIHVSIVAASSILLTRALKDKKITIYNKEIFCNLMFNFNLLSLMAIPLYFEADIFVRFLRAILLINLAIYSVLIFYSRFFIKCLILIAFLSAFMIFTFIVPQMHGTILPLIKFNLLF